ncbi:MAG: MarR family transcriptional regulator [Oscillospiraceae bacterium]|nr:MarR family transcriptional regulator [Oscillospiraceae bacterium]
MQPGAHLQYFTATKTLYSACLEPVCRTYGLSRTELDILLFLSNNPQYDTAAEICEIRDLVKSHVSTSIQALEKAGFLERYQLPGDRRAIHLRILSGADAAVVDGRAAQEQFRNVLCAGLALEEQRILEKAIATGLKNVKKFMEEMKLC